ncbi:hypothetical protein EJ377_00120 [Chryseobacterium arthrosphaerae]|uniref:Uncharacterized protein n=1 Tax=Chryseobacterium arthrosphaerae TaxID=651561 RepID=A0A3S0PRL4_9FLAO|nr:hypothetical protein EJ377_00120 [Chryseobacterium arthrosphaerae]
MQKNDSVIAAQGYKVVCCSGCQRFDANMGIDNTLIEVVEVDFLKPETLKNIPEILREPYLMHSMSTANDYEMRKAMRRNSLNI